jgi:hypothetical protein
MELAASEPKGIKDIIEVLEGIKVIGVPLKAALKDGLSVADLPKLLDIVKQYQVIIDAVEGIGDVIPEAKDIDSAEAVVIVAKVMEVIKAIKEA